ncbi:MAG: hypothetical protein FWG87_01335 [Defluviitaleaceae bacterium]|nr:hypothetical protein [Defluviitaleaceae bacterium]
MGDVFNEQIVKRVPTLKDTIIKACIWVLVGVIGAASFVVLSHFAMLVVLGLFFGARFLIGYLNVEYEYAFTNGELDIDIIYDQLRRKRVFSVNMRQIEAMAQLNDSKHAAAFGAAQERRDYSSGVHGADTYALVAVQGGRRILVIIEPNEKMLRALKR